MGESAEIGDGFQLKPRIFQQLFHPFKLDGMDFLKDRVPCGFSEAYVSHPPRTRKDVRHPVRSQSGACLSADEIKGRSYSPVGRGDEMCGAAADDS